MWLATEYIEGYNTVIPNVLVASDHIYRYVDRFITH